MLGDIQANAQAGQLIGIEILGGLVAQIDKVHGGSGYG
jgi:hypothetical protein